MMLARQIRQEPKMASAQIDIPQDILDSARLSPAALKQELAISLYVQRRLSIGKARELAGMSLWQFRQLLSSREVPAHYDQKELLEDLDTVSNWDRSAS
jgi:predicted HTH domain antitoxin